MSDEGSEEALRTRVAVELAVLATATTVFLALAPHDTVLFVVCALLAFGFVLARAHEIQTRFWTKPVSAAGLRRRRAVFAMALTTVPTMVVFASIAQSQARPLFTSALAKSLLLYLPWAAVQQTLFQFYLHGHLRVLMPEWTPIVPSLLTAFCYGVVHLPDARLAALTGCAGVIWSLSYQRNRWLPPLVVSHALLGATLYAWVRGEDALALLLRAAGG
jgi:hypothetical protein